MSGRPLILEHLVPAFRYQALDNAGVRQDGRIEAQTAEAARRHLRDQMLTPLVLVETHESFAGNRRRGNPIHERQSRPLPVGTSAVVLRQLATLCGSSVRIDEALRIAARQSPSARAAAVLERARNKVTDGQSFASALSSLGGAFPVSVVASVAAGERSGRLPEVLAQLAAHLEARSATQGKLGLALLYPAILAGVSILMVGLLMAFVVPDIVRVFETRAVELPLLTRALICVSDGLSRYGVQLLLLLTAIGVVLFRWSRRPSVRLRLHRWVVMTVGVRNLSRKLNAARFAGTLATLVQSGVPLLEALRTSREAVTNIHVRDRIETAARRVHDGGSLAAALEEAGCFPPILVAMSASGETSGRLGPALAQASEDQQRELDQTIAALVALVEPVVLLFMGGVILLLVLAILTPIVELNNLAG